MEQTLRLLGGIGLGAGLMYFLDPQQGRRRRALVRDQFTHLSREACDAADVTAFVRTYAEGQGLVALVGSSGFLEVAEVNGNAAAHLGCEARRTIEAGFSSGVR